MVIYGDIVVIFLRILSTKPIISHKLKIRRKVSSASECCASFWTKYPFFSELTPKLLIKLSI